MTAAYARPGYTDLKARIAADLAAMPAVLGGPLSEAWARACHGQHGHLEWIDKQCSPLTCDLERLYDWAALYGVGRLSSTAAAGFALATGTIGTHLLAGAQLRGPNGLDYTVQAAAILGADATPVSVRCVEVGRAGNLAAGQALTLVDPLPGCFGAPIIAAPGLTGGEDEEDVDDWRARVADEWRTVVSRGSRSGKPEDYRFWARSAHPSVTTALVQPHALGVGTVLVRPICNALPDRQPTQAVLDAVAAYLYSTAPATADWKLAAPMVRYVNVSIQLPPAIDSGALRSDISAAIKAAIATKASETSVLLRAEIDAAVGQVVDQYTLLVPAGNTAVEAGEVLVLGVLEWV